MTAELKSRIDALKTAQEIIWLFRDNASTWWDSPGTYNSLRFMATETSETIDASLRMNPLFNRNNDRKMDPLAEWADVVVMALTALGRDAEIVIKPSSIEQMIKFCDSRGIDPIDVAHYFAAEALYSYILDAIWTSDGEAEVVWKYRVVDVLTLALTVLGDGVCDAVTARLDAIWTKNQIRQIAS